MHWWRPRGEAGFNATLDAYKIPWEQLLKEVEDGTAQECFAKHLYRNRKEYGLTDNEAMFAGTSAHGALLTKF
jgi:hypothetical protein